MNIRSYISFLLFLGLTSCSATGPVFDKNLISKNSNLNMYIYREKSPVAAAIRPQVFIDGKSTFTLAQNGFAAVALPTGKHVIQTKKGNLMVRGLPTSISINIQQNQKYYIKWVPKKDKSKTQLVYAVGTGYIPTGGLVAKFIQVNEAQALKELSLLKKVN